MCVSKVSVLIVILIAVALELLVQETLLANITGSSHDFSGVSLGHNEGEICKVCHVPHNAGAGSTEVPLWRGRLATLTYQVYSSDTLNASVGQPQAPTKACLTCHDGAIARGPVAGCSSCHNVHGRPGDRDLMNDHPVSFTYDGALAQSDGALQDPDSASVPSLGGKTIKEGMLYQGRLECPSCHDVHATKGDSSSAPKLLLVDNSHDRLCFTCHIK